ncbi:hypothetical protein [Yoonia sp.]|uniref:hypothetical protein n=1 Tax=Yoonia sp. TaxID=2212373 RepID=UPI003F4AA489
MAIFASCGAAAYADDNLPSCVTSFDQGGTIAERYAAVVNAPVPFDAATSGSELVETFGGMVRSDNGFLAVGFPSSGPASAEITFFASNVAVYQCVIDLVSYDASRHSVAQLGYGDCGPTVPELETNQTEVFDVDGQPVELLVLPSSIIRGTLKMGPVIEVMPRAAGTGQVTWLSMQDGASKVAGLCPVIIR